MPRVAETSEFWLRLAEMVGKDFPKNNQAAVGKLFKVGQSAITKWKTGKDTPALPRAIDIAIEYGVCVEWLLTGRGPKHPFDAPDADMARLLEFWSKLLPDTKHHVVGYAAYRRSIQNSAPVERNKEVHDQLAAANKNARKKLPRRPGPR